MLSYQTGYQLRTDNISRSFQPGNDKEVCENTRLHYRKGNGPTCAKVTGSYDFILLRGGRCFESCTSHEENQRVAIMATLFILYWVKHIYNEFIQNLRFIVLRLHLYTILLENLNLYQVLIIIL